MSKPSDLLLEDLALDVGLFCVWFASNPQVHNLPDDQICDLYAQYVKQLAVQVLKRN